MSMRALPSPLLFVEAEPLLDVLALLDERDREDFLRVVLEPDSEEPSFLASGFASGLASGLEAGFLVPVFAPVLEGAGVAPSAISFGATFLRRWPPRFLVVFFVVPLSAAVELSFFDASRFENEQTRV